jgi:mRNA-degrading endonuclease RelE of RelBE toxin-antitoxin system
MPNWTLKIARRAEKAIDRFPDKDQRLILQALDAMAVDPFNGDIVRLHNERSEWRWRVGNYRIFFDVYDAIKIVDVVDVSRRTSKTY